MTTKRILPLVVFTATLIVGPAVAGSLFPRLGTSFAEEAQSTDYVLGIEGMSCPIGCAPKVQETLESVDGVESASVNFDEKQAIVHMAPGKSLTKESCDKAFGNSGYSVSTFAEKSQAGQDSGS